MSTPEQKRLIEYKSNDYWPHSGSEKGKGRLQRFIDKLLAITTTILQGGKLTLADEEIIYEAMSACDDIKNMSKNWPERMSFLRKKLTLEQLAQAVSNKVAVEALIAQVIPLLLALQNACDSNNYAWAVIKEDVIRNVEQSWKNARKNARRNVEQSCVGDAHGQSKPLTSEVREEVPTRAFVDAHSRTRSALTNLDGEGSWMLKAKFECDSIQCLSIQLLSSMCVCGGLCLSKRCTRTLADNRREHTLAFSLVQHCKQKIRSSQKSV